MVDFDVMRMRDQRVWGFDDAQREVLVAATDGLPEVAAIVTRAQRHSQLPELWIVRATGNELNDVYSLVESLMDTTRSKRRLELLEGMLASLSSSIDGF